MTAPALADIRAAYARFVAGKMRMAPVTGIDIGDVVPHAWLKPHAGAVVRWMLHGGRRAVFAGFGLAKTSMQIEAGVQTLLRAPTERGLITLPLNVRREFRRDAISLEVEQRLGRPLTFVQSTAECAAPGLYMTNYESVREGKLDPSGFVFASLDEAAILRGMGGTKTFREAMRVYEDTPFRFVCTATPSPNEYIELLAYAAFLGVMDIGEAKTRFFGRNSEKADDLTLLPHMEEQFWMWVASWALFFDFPSDLGFPDDGYVLPEMTVNWHEVKVDHREAETEKSGQGVLFRQGSLNVVDASREKRATMVARVTRMSEILARDPPGTRRILWHDLEAERRMIEEAVPTCASIYGAQTMDQREPIMEAFCEGFLDHLAAKPSMLGAGTNPQRHCHAAVYVGISSKFHDFIQSIHRLQRFGQQYPVTVDVIFAESERPTVENLKKKWRLHEKERARMREIVKTFGLAEMETAKALTRAMFDEDKQRVEVTIPGDDGATVATLVHNDTVLECMSMQSDSVDLIVTSIPFGTQFEYSPSYNDFGHNEDMAHFFEQMSYLAPQLLRVLKPGRLCAIHVKDRIVPGGMTGLGFQTVYPFADDVRASMRAAGWAYMGEKTNLTDVVRENNQTYRLGHTEQLKDGTKMGSGLPEKVLVFRKPPTDRSNGYADTPVVKPRPDYVDEDGRPVRYTRAAEKAGKIRPVPGGGYSRARWQIDAHHLMRTSGDRLVEPREWTGFDARRIYRAWKAINLTQVYDFEFHVAIGEQLTFKGKLPPTFMLLPPHSWHVDVWTDVMQARGLNTVAHVDGAEKHLCPLPFDIVNRLISQMSEEGELVFDPFGGLGTVAYCAIKLGRRGRCHELKPEHFADSVTYCQAVAKQIALPTLWDALGLNGDGEDEDLPEDLQAHPVREEAA